MYDNTPVWTLHIHIFLLIDIIQLVLKASYDTFQKFGEKCLYNWERNFLLCKNQIMLNMIIFDKKKYVNIVESMKNVMKMKSV